MSSRSFRRSRGQPPHRLFTEARFDHTGVRRELTGQDAGMNIGAVLAQTAQAACVGIASRSDVYIALVGVHVTVDVLVGWSQVGVEVAG